MKTLNVVFVIVCANVSGPVLYMFKAAGKISPIFAVFLIGAGFEIVTVCVRKSGYPPGCGLVAILTGTILLQETRFHVQHKGN